MIKKISAATIIVWLFLLWSWTYYQKNITFEQERHRANLIAETLAASNIIPLQRQMETGLTLAGVDRMAGVQAAFVLDAQNRIVAPLSYYGRKLPPGLKNHVEKQIVDPDKNILGKAVVVFVPESPGFVLLWIIFLVPPSVAVLFWFSWKRRKAREKQLVTETPKESRFHWLKAVGRFVEGSLFVFDEEGNILASSKEETPRHLLDLFPDAAQAQAALGSLQELQNGVEHRHLAEWRDDHGKTRFILAHR